MRSSAASRAEDPKEELDRPPNPKLPPPKEDDADDAPPNPKPDGACDEKGEGSEDDMSSRSSSEGIEMVGLTVLMDEPEGRLMTVCGVGWAYGFDSSSKRRRRG